MRGKVLLGWLTRENAIKYLQNDCIFNPPLTVEQAEALWAEKKAAVDALEPRNVPAPAQLALKPAEQEAANRFLAALRRNPGGLGVVQRIVKLDPRGLVCRQFDVNLDRANEHAAHIESPHWSTRNCLALKRENQNQQLPWVAIPGGWDFTLPHGEFMLGFDGQLFGIVQGSPHLTVSSIETRTVLWAGYHRCYARAAAMVNPETKERSVLAALTTEAGLAVATNQPLRDLLFAERPALFGDFFDERLCMEVELRRKRYELQIRVELAKINVDQV
jgi:hypothetical protein